MRGVARWLWIAVLCLPGIARADDTERRLAELENEARQLGTDLPEPGRATLATGPRRLVDAQAAFALGEYDAAALALFELSSQPGPDQLTALYYLGESLYQKGDKGAARTYFEQIAASPSVTSRHYQPALLRLVEIAIALRDLGAVDKQLAALDAIPPASRLPEVAYVRGKYAFATDRYDDALRYLAEVPKGSSHEYQAAYFTATALVAKKDVARATDVLTELIARKPRTTNERRVIELAQLALGRLYYERDQPSKSIDSYLMIDRRSDLFPDALYEVAWVYVKSKQYDKALRALELLHLSDPTSQKTPTVRILEGNLRIRKAQLIRQQVIAGTVEKGGATEPAVEYDRAAAVFAETHDMYLPSYQALERMVASPGDPAQYLAQIAGRSPTIFQATAPIPEAAAAYLREEPEVQRAVAVETDLAGVESDLAESEAILARLEGVLTAADRSAAYPALQQRRTRIGQVQDALHKLRAELADQQLRLAEGGGGAAASLTAARRAAQQQVAAAPNAEQAHADRIGQVQQQYDGIERSAEEVAAAIDSTQAIAVALRKFAIDASPQPSTAGPNDQKAQIAETLDSAAKEAAAIEQELAELQRELVLGRDLAGTGDETSAQLAKAREARRQLAAALDAEHRALAGAARGKAQKLSALGARAAQVSASLAALDTQIDAMVERGVQQVKAQIATERASIAQSKAELAQLEAQSRGIGGEVLGASFRDVKAKFYDIVIRTDVGIVDVSWSQKEDDDDDLKRLNLSRQRDLKQLRDEFKGILEELGPAKPEAPKPPPPPMPDPGAGGSPDKGGTGTRIKPGGDGAAKPAAPTVRPDNEPPKAPAKKAGAR